MKRQVCIFLLASFAISCGNNSSVPSTKKTDLTLYLKKKSHLDSITTGSPLKIKGISVPVGKPEIVPAGKPKITLTNENVFIAGKPNISMASGMVKNTPGKDKYELPKISPAKGLVTLCKQPISHF
ncbi:MAG: hypothetical protein ACXVNN_01745 [Bacteroidia bacterium]